MEFPDSRQVFRTRDQNERLCGLESAGALLAHLRVVVRCDTASRRDVRGFARGVSALECRATVRQFGEARGRFSLLDSNLTPSQGGPDDAHLLVVKTFTNILLVAVLALLSACGPSESSSSTDATPAGGKRAAGTIGVSLLTLDNPFFKVIGDNIQSEGRKHGYEAIVVSGDKDVAKQGNQIKDFIVKKVSAIVLSPCDSKSIIPVIQEANAAGIPVFTVDIPCNEPGVKIVTQVATDNYGGGKEAAQAMIEALGEQGGKVAILHFKQAESCLLRVKGFREVIEAHNKTGKAKIDMATELERGGAKDIGFKAAEDALQAHPDLRGIFAINDPAALGARAALEKAGKTQQVVLVGFDGQPEGKQAIKDGKIYADPIQFPDRMGVQIVDAIVRHSKGESLPAQMLIPTSLYRKADAMKDPELK